MDYKKGERGKHPGRPEWGPGQVLEDSRDEKVRVFFSGDGRKILSLKHVEPIKVSGEEARHPILDHLWVREGGEGKYRNPQQSTELLLKNYPEGFYGQQYLKAERDSKMAAHALAQDLLGPGPLQQLIGDRNYEEICRRALKVVQATKLIMLNEKNALQEALKDPRIQDGRVPQLMHVEGRLEIAADEIVHQPPAAAVSEQDPLHIIPSPVLPRPGLREDPPVPDRGPSPRKRLQRQEGTDR
jgi:hypothetical protein